MLLKKKLLLTMLGLAIIPIVILGVSAASEETTAALDQISKAVNDASVSITKISDEMDVFKTE